jgi:hypothetical protein
MTAIVGPKNRFYLCTRINKIREKMKRIKVCSLDFLMYAQEVRLEEDELMDEGCMEECERLSVADMRRSYAKYLRDLASY